MHGWDNDKPKTRGRARRALVADAGVAGTVAFAAASVAPVTASAKTLPAHKKTQAPVSTVNVPFFTATTPKSFPAQASSLKTAVSSARMMVLGQRNQAGALSVTGFHLKGAETFSWPLPGSSSWQRRRAGRSCSPSPRTGTPPTRRSPCT